MNLQGGTEDTPELIGIASHQLKVQIALSGGNHGSIDEGEHGDNSTYNATDSIVLYAKGLKNYT